MLEILQQIKVIGFDLDGTLYPLTPEIQKRVRRLIYQKLSEQIRIPLKQAENLFEDNYKELLSGSRTIKKIGEMFGREIKRDIVQEAVEEADVTELINPNPEVERVLNILAKKRKIDLITGSRYSVALQKLKRIGINPEIFGCIISGEDGSKSDGHIYKLWIEKRSLSPEHLLYVGDNPRQDVEEPRNFGIMTCILGKCKFADIEITSISDLEKLLLYAII